MPLHSGTADGGKDKGRVAWTVARVLGTRRYRLGFAAKYALMNWSVRSRTSSLTEANFCDPTVPMIPVADQVVARIDTAGL